MPSTATDRLSGLTTSVAVKAPCNAVSTVAIMLSGEQTVGGVPCVTGNRVLLAIAGGSVNNGIWTVDTGAWDRAKDFDGTRDVVTGTMVLVKPGTGGEEFWFVTTTGAIIPGATVIAIEHHTPEELQLRADFANTADAARSDALLGVRKTRAGALATTQHALNETRMFDLVADGGLIGDGVTLGNVAKMQTAVASASGESDFYLPSGNYVWDADFTPPGNFRLFFAQGARLLASANNRIFFKTTVNTFNSQIFFPYCDPNGKTGCTGFDLIGFRASSGIYWPRFTAGLTNGIILRELCWDTEIINPFCSGVTNPIKVMSGSNTVRIEKPSFDGLGSAGNGIVITRGTYDTTTVRIIGGYIQGFANGVVDSGIGTIIDGTYFENCTVADISFVASLRGCARSTQHYAAVGPVAIKSRNSDGVTVLDPLMTSGSRSVGLFDFDATNVNCNALRVATAGGMNLPEGVIAGIGSIAVENSGTFTAVVAGSTVAGAGTYTRQSGTWRRIGKQVHVQVEVTWTAHTGTGNITVTGVPVTLTPVSFIPFRIGQLVFSAGVTVTSLLVYSFMNGTNANIGLQQTSAAGAASPISMAGTGSLFIDIVYDL